MSNISCPKCGAKHDKVLEECPECKWQRKIISCPKCSAKHDKSLDECPECGWQRNAGKTYKNIYAFFIEYKNSSYLKNAGGCGVMMIVLIVGGFLLGVMKRWEGQPWWMQLLVGFALLLFLGGGAYLLWFLHHMQLFYRKKFPREKK